MATKYSKQLRRRTAGRDKILAQHSSEEWLKLVFDNQRKKLRGDLNEYFVCDIKITDKKYEKVNGTETFLIQ